MAIIGIFLVFAALGVLAFAGFRGIGNDKEDSVGKIVVWGTVSSTNMEEVLDPLRFDGQVYDGVSYVEKDVRTYAAELINALAAGRGPDLFLLEHDQLLQFEDKLTVVPYDTYSEREFKDTFIEGGEIFLTPTGILSLPFSVDPMVMFWNRDIFTSESVANPPEYWDEFFVLAPVLTEVDQASNIERSFVAMGEYRNVTHAKQALSTLIMQAGNPITVRDEFGRVHPALDNNRDYPASAVDSALRFYTEFSNPVKSVYSWNRALPSAREAFAAGDVAVYLGFASELALIKNINPNLNFDVAPMPQPRDAATRITFGNVQGLAIPRNTKRPNDSFKVARTLSEAASVQRLEAQTGLPSVRRDVLRAKPEDDAARAVFFDSALWVRAWSDPDPQGTNAIFQEMIESTVSGRARISEAVGDADRELEQLLE